MPREPVVLRHGSHSSLRRNGKTCKAENLRLATSTTRPPTVPIPTDLIWSPAEQISCLIHPAASCRVMSPLRRGERVPPPPTPHPPPSPPPLHPSQQPLILPAQPLPQYLVPSPHFHPPIPPPPAPPPPPLETPDSEPIPLVPPPDRHSDGPAPLLAGTSPEPHRLLEVLDSLGRLGFVSITDFLIRLFGSDDPAVRRRVSPFYAQGGAKSLMEIFMNSRRARENGGDEVAVSWSGVVFKDEFDIGLVKGGVRYLHLHCAPLRVLTS